jgi:hypothetical protein
MTNHACTQWNFPLAPGFVDARGKTHPAEQALPFLSTIQLADS